MSHLKPVIVRFVMPKRVRYANAISEKGVVRLSEHIVRQVRKLIGRGRSLGSYIYVAVVIEDSKPRLASNNIPYYAKGGVRLADYAEADGLKTLIPEKLQLKRARRQVVRAVMLVGSKEKRAEFDAKVPRGQLPHKKRCRQG